MERLVVVDRTASVTRLTLNRPDARNALSIALRRALARTLAETAGDEATAVLVLTGAGTAFCSGMDTTEFGGDADHRTALYQSTVDLFEALAAVPVPMIAAVNGPALGGGFALAAACDVRLASPTASFGHPEVARGIPAAVGTLLRVVPQQVGLELAFTGRTVGAEEALAFGIVREIHGDVVARAEGLGREMAGVGRAVLVATKRLFAAAGDDRIERALRAEREMFRSALFRE